MKTLYELPVQVFNIKEYEAAEKLGVEHNEYYTINQYVDLQELESVRPNKTEEERGTILIMKSGDELFVAMYFEEFLGLLDTIEIKTMRVQRNEEEKKPN